MPKRYSTPSASNALRTAIAPVIFSLAMSSLPPLRARRLELRDRVVLRYQEPQLVDAVHEAVAGERVDLELRLGAVGERYRLRSQIDGHLRARRADELRDRGGLEDDGQQPVLERVVPE